MFSSFFKKKLIRMFDDNLIKAENGISDSQLFVADMYREGAGISPNIKQAVFWYKKASKNGDIEAAYKLGYLYATGEGVKKNRGKAIAYFTHASLQGHKKSTKIVEQILSGRFIK